MLQLQCKNQGQVVYFYYSGTLFEIENRERDDWALLYAEYCIIGNPIVVYLVTPPPSIQSYCQPQIIFILVLHKVLLARSSPDYRSFCCDC